MPAKLYDQGGLLLLGYIAKQLVGLHYFTFLNKDFYCNHTGGIHLSISRMASSIYTNLLFNPSMIVRLRLMYQAPEDVELTFQTDGSKTVGQVHA